MADQDVNIVGYDGGPIPEWATEKTLESMLDQIGELVDITKKQRTELKQAVKGSGGSGSSGNKDVEKKQKEAANLLGQLSKSLKDATGSAVDSAAGFDKLPGPLSKFTKNLKNTNKAAWGVAAALGIIGNQAAKAVVSIREQVSSLRDLSDSGIQLHGSFMEMSRGLAQAGMTIEEFSELAGKYAQVVNRQGFISITKLASAVNEAEGGFKKWGITTAEGTQITAELLDQQRRAGLFRSINQDREEKTITEIMDRMTAYSKVLNVSRQEMLEGRKEMLNDAEVRFRISQMTAQERELLEKGLGNTAISLEALGDDASWVSQAIKEGAVNQINEQSEMWQQLASAGLTPLANDLAALGDAAARGEEVTMEQVEAVLAHHGQNKAFMENLFKAGGASKEWATKLGNASLTVEEAAANRANMEKKVGEEQMDAVDGNVQTLTALQDATNRFMSTIEHVRVQGFMALLGDSAEAGIQGAINGLNKMTDAMLKFSDSGKIEEAGQWVKDHWAGIAGGMVAAIALMSRNIRLLGSKFMGLGANVGKLGMTMGGVAAAFIGWEIGSQIYDKFENTEGMIGFGDKLGGITDTVLANVFGSKAAERRLDAMNGVMSPEAERTAAQARKRRAERTAAAQSSDASTSAAATSDTTPVEAGMSEADLAKLSQGERTNYYLSELLKSNRKLARNLSGDVFAQ